MRAWTLFRASAATAVLHAVLACGGGDPIDLKLEMLEPDEGPIGGGQMVTVRGEGFLAGGAAPNMALFGDSLTMSVSAVSDTELQIVTPPGVEPGEVDVLIFNTNGYGIAAGAYTYVAPPELDSIDPPTGLYRGGEEVTLSGSGFVDNGAGAPTVTFDGRPADLVEIVSDDEVVVRAPPGPPYSTADVALSNNRGRAELADAYRYTIVGLIVVGGQYGAVGQMFFVDVDTGTVIPRSDPDGIAAHGMATDDEGTVFMADHDDYNLWRVSPVTGAKTTVGFMSIDDTLSGARAIDLEFHDGALYSYSRNNSTFGTVDTGTGAFTSFPNAAPNGCCNTGRSLVSHDGVLYFTHGAQLYTVDTSDGTTTAVAGVTIALQRINGTAEVDGEVYAIAKGTAGGKGGLWGSNQTSTVWRLDLETGQTTFVASLPTQVHGITRAP